jgi:transcriptional regulator with PAS, ATPase and Fis domain
MLADIHSGARRPIDCVRESAPREPDGSAPHAAAGGALSPIPGFVTADVATIRELARARHFAASHLSVLISGESGTGKELLAEGVHLASPRAARPWVPVNCGALPPSLEEAELFGARRGAFTGAVADRVGLIEEASGGTLFLDEVGEMGPATQAKLLRVLEQGEVRRLGENRVRKVDVRIVAATNRTLEARIRAGTFREDLYYRLCGAPIHVPPLRERPDDVPLLVAHLLGQLSRRYGGSVGVEPGVTRALRRRRWPGNVRQLRNEVERAAIIARAEDRAVRICDFAAEPERSREDGFSERVAAFERGLILDALRTANGNRTLAARLLGGMKRTTLIGKIRRLGIDGESEGGGGAPPASLNGAGGA